MDYAPDNISALEELLETFKQTAVTEQLTEFDPSGSSGGLVRLNQGKQSDEVDSNAETWTSATTETDYTSLSNELATLGLEGSPSSWEESTRGYSREAETKEQRLADTFPALRPEFVAYTLKKCGDDLGRATDELLNHNYFEDVKGSPEEEVSVVKGIEAFSEEYHLPQRGKKGKKKKKQKGVNLYDAGLTSTSESALNPTSPVTNRWKDSGRDIDFLASRTNISQKTITSLYHENGTSLSRTLAAILKKTIATHAGEEPSASVIQPALSLTDAFPTLDLAHATALIHLTSPSTAHANDLAKHLTMSPTSPTSSIDRVVPQYAPIALSDPTPLPANLPALTPSFNPHTSSSLSATRSAAFDSASTAYRRGRSNPLFKAAAGYYSQIGRDATAHLHAAREADADAFVASQSTSKMLDLHGVTVDSATRIAKLKTREWWEGLGEQRVKGYGGGRGGSREPFTIVTGLGRHSEGGRGRIGPAVFKALTAEGWRVEVEGGEVRVTGRARG